MINGLFVFKNPSGILLFEKKFENTQIDSDLFSGLLSAIRNFTSAIHMGELTSFETHNKRIQVSLTENIVVAIIMDITDSVDEWQGIAYDVGCSFCETYDLSKFSGNRTQFLPFNEILHEFLNSKQDSFIVQIAKWASKEFGGDLHIDQRLITSDDHKVSIDIIIDRGELINLKLMEKMVKKLYKGYNRDLIFFKVQEGVFGLRDLEIFIESCKELGYECYRKDRCEQYFDYFPSKIIIIANEFSPPALDKIQELTHFDKKQEKHFIISNQIGKHTRKAVIKGKVPMLQCYVELWTWKLPYPERIFE